MKNFFYFLILVFTFIGCNTSIDESVNSSSHSSLKKSEYGNLKFGMLGVWPIRDINVTISDVPNNDTTRYAIGNLLYNMRYDLHIEKIELAGWIGNNVDVLVQSNFNTALQYWNASDILIPIPEWRFKQANSLNSSSVLTQYIDSCYYAVGGTSFYIDEPQYQYSLGDTCYTAAFITAIGNQIQTRTGGTGKLYVSDPNQVVNYNSTYYTGVTHLMPDDYKSSLDFKTQTYADWGNYKSLAPIIGLMFKAGMNTSCVPAPQDYIDEIDTSLNYTDEVWFYIRESSDTVDDYPANSGVRFNLFRKDLDYWWNLKTAIENYK